MTHSAFSGKKLSGDGGNELLEIVRLKISHILKMLIPQSIYGWDVQI